MNITKAQYARIEKYFPVQRGNVKIDNYTFINAILYITENGCKWRALPEKYGKWNSIYQRFKRWCENGVIQRIFNALQQEKIIAIKVEVLALDSTSCKLHPDAHGALKNTDNNVSGNQRADGIPSFNNKFATAIVATLPYGSAMMTGEIISWLCDVGTVVAVLSVVFTFVCGCCTGGTFTVVETILNFLLSYVLPTIIACVLMIYYGFKKGIGCRYTINLLGGSSVSF